MTTWYVRDNSTFGFPANSISASTPGSVGWSAVTGWAASASISAGTLRRQSAGTASFTASASTTTLTVTAVSAGTIYLGMLVNTTTEAAGSGTFRFVSAYGTGTGGTGTYTLSVTTTQASTTWTGGFQAGIQRVYVATQSSAGTTGTTEPSWSINANVNNNKGAKVTDNTVTWVECTAQPAVNGDMTNTPASSTVRSLAQSVGKIIKDNGATHIFICTTAGTPGSGEPTYVTTSVGSTTTDGGATWTYIGASFSNWAAPAAYVNTLTVANYSAAGDTIYVGDDHSEIFAQFTNTGITTTGTQASPNFYYSIDHTLSLPVSSSGLKSGATIGSNQTLTLYSSSLTAASTYWDGFTFSTTGTNISMPTTAITGWVRLENCNLKLNNSGSTSKIFLNGTGAATSLLELVNTTVQFGAVGQTLEPTGATRVIWRNTASAILGTVPTTLFNPASTGVLVCEGVDFSAETGTLVPAGTSANMQGVFQFIDCKLGSGVTVAGTPVDRGGPVVDAIRCSSTSSTYVQRRYWYAGSLQEETTVIRTSGASDGTTGISWNLTTTANSKWVSPFESFPIAIWNATTGANRTVTLHGIWNSASLPNNDDVWVDVAYLGDSGSPLASLATETKSNNLASGSALTADSSSAWDSIASARQNSHAYSLGNVIKTSSNAGRIFFCTTAGTTASSEPGGYAGAADGGSVTDSGAVFRAGTRFLLTITLSTPQPQLVGYLRAYVKAAKASSTFYVDPLIVLS